MFITAFCVIALLGAVVHADPQDLLCSNVDAVFMIDSSQSITSDKFAKIQKYTQSFVNLFDIGSDSNRAQFGGVLFNEQAQYLWALNKYPDKQSLLVNLHDLPYTVGATNLERAFEAAYGVMSGTGARAGSCKGVIVFTDGWADVGSQEQHWADRIRTELKAKILMIAVEGVNGHLAPYNQPVLEQLSGNSQYVFKLNQLQPNFQ